MISYTPTFSSRSFTVSGKTFIGEASTLTKGNTIPLYGRVYPDACDVGFRMNSFITGAESVWYLEGETVEDGDLIQWNFLPTPESVRKFPKLAGWKVTIFND